MHWLCQCETPFIRSLQPGTPARITEKRFFLKNVDSYLHLGCLNDLSLFCFCTCRLNWLAHESACQCTVLSPPIINNKHDFLSLWATAEALYSRGEDSYKSCLLSEQIQSENTVGNILYRSHEVHDAHCCLFGNSLQHHRKAIKKNHAGCFCIFQASIRRDFHLDSNVLKTIG